MADVSGRRFVVTGAASGIGHAVAERLLTAGAEVYSLDRNTPSAAVVDHIEVDLASPHSIDAALATLCR
jgi:NAD(P)-dependent dehydrogenase (short-subunit alcohol dehydrogenase family)